MTSWPRKPEASPNGSHAKIVPAIPSETSVEASPIACASFRHSAFGRTGLIAAVELTASFEPVPPPLQAVASSSTPSARAALHIGLAHMCCTPSAMARSSPEPSLAGPAGRYEGLRAAGARPQLFCQMRRDGSEQPEEDPQRDGDRLPVGVGQLL